MQNVRYVMHGEWFENMEIFIWIAFSLIGGGIAKLLRLPAPFLVGGILSVSIVNIITSRVILPSYLPLILQIASGTLIGSAFTKRDLLGIKKVLLPALFMVFFMVVNNLCIGSLIAAVSHLDLLTALMGTIPGGVTESVLMATVMGADVSSVAVMQLMRLVLSLIFFPSLISFLIRNDDPYIQEEEEESERRALNFPSLRVLLTLVFGIAGGIGGIYLPFLPVASMICSMVAVAIANIFFFDTLFPKVGKKGAQVLTGILVGSRVTISTVMSLKTLLIPVLIMIVGFLLIHSLNGILTAKLFKMNKPVMLFCSIPAGASDIALIASEMKYESPIIALFQIVRLVSCITIFPLVIKLFVMVVPH